MLPEAAGPIKFEDLGFRPAHMLGKNKYMLFAGWKVRMVKNCDRGLEKKKHFQAQGHSFYLRNDLKPANNMFIFFLPAVNWLYKLQMGLFTQLLSFNGLARRPPTICKKSWQRTTQSRQKNDVLKNRLF